MLFVYLLVMERITAESSFKPTAHAIARLQERFYPNVNEERAAEILRNLAKNARPLKRTVTFTEVGRA